KMASGSWRIEFTGEGGTLYTAGPAPYPFGRQYNFVPGGAGFAALKIDVSGITGSLALRKDARGGSFGSSSKVLVDLTRFSKPRDFGYQCPLAPASDTSTCHLPNVLLGEYTIGVQLTDDLELCSMRETQGIWDLRIPTPTLQLVP